MVDFEDFELCNKVVYEFCQFGVECIWYIGDVFCMGMMVEEVFNFINIDCWYFVQFEDFIFFEVKVVEFGLLGIDVDFMCVFKCKGFFDVCFVELIKVVESDICEICCDFGIFFVYKCVDICVVEFFISIVYMYLMYDEECEVVLIDKDKIMVLGGGLN